MNILNLTQLALMPLKWLCKFLKKQLIDEINKDMAREEISLIKSRITFLESQIQDMQFKILYLKNCLQNTEQDK